MEMLNSLFGYGSWDWTYKIEQALSYPNTQQMVLTGELTVRIHDPESGELKATIKKTASGGVDTKFLRESKTPVDLADDVKAASADALKKAASMIGIAADVFYPNVYTAKAGVQAKQKNQNAAPTPITGEVVDEAVSAEVEQVETNGTPEQRAHMIKTLFAIAKELGTKGKIALLGKSDEDKKTAVYNYLKENGVDIPSFSKATLQELEEAAAKLQELNK